jgi:hypothetical protein
MPRLFESLISRVAIQAVLKLGKCGVVRPKCTGVHVSAISGVGSSQNILHLFTPLQFWQNLLDGQAPVAFGARWCAN